MNHLPPMIVDLAVILIAAAVSTLLFSRLRQPIVLGYLVAGFAVGPHFPAFPNVVDTEGVKLWAEIGVIFLLFGLGLEFSFKKLAKVGKSALIAATFEIITMGGFGYLFGRALGWTVMDSIFLGAILSMSSTTIIVRAFSEAGLRGRGFVSLVFGILIVEDLMAILLMVILSAISVPGSFSGGNLLFLSARLAFFLLLWFVVGIYVLPTVLHKLRKLMSNEIMLIFSIGLCFMMVAIATQADFSSALGAFIMGSILAETEEGERIERLLTSVKDLFAAIFFVSVGMMIDPSILREHFGVVVLITIITIVGKLLGSGFGAVLSGRSLRHSVQAGMSLAQIGEFSFIIATLGVTLKVTSDFLYPIVIAVSAVTTFTTPYMIRYSDRIYLWIESKLPQKFIDRLAQYERAMASNGREGALHLLWRLYGMSTAINAVVALAIGLASARFVLPWLLDLFQPDRMVRFIACVVTLIACSPFLIALSFKSPKKLSKEETETLVRLRRLQIGILALRLILALVVIAAIINQFTTTRTLPILVLILSPVILVAYRRPLESLYEMVERRFLQNLNAKELAEIESVVDHPQLAPWDATLTSVILTSDSKIAGKTLEEIQFRTKTGATISMIDRGRKRIFAPGRHERLLPNDEIFLIGTEEQLAEAQRLLAAEPALDTPPSDDLYNLDTVFIDKNSPFVNKTIRDVGIGEQFGSLVVGIERKGQRILNPESNVTFEPGDLVWVFGQRDGIRKLKQQRLA